MNLFKTIIFSGLLATTATAVGQVPLELYEGQPHTFSVTSDETLDYSWSAYTELSITPETLPTSDAILTNADQENVTAQFNAAGFYILKVDGYRQTDESMNTKAIAVNVLPNNFYVYFDPTAGSDCVTGIDEYTFTASLRFEERVDATASSIDVDGFYPVTVNPKYRVKTSDMAEYDENWYSLSEVEYDSSTIDGLLSVTIKQADVTADLSEGAEIEVAFESCTSALGMELKQGDDAVFRFFMYPTPVTPNFDLALSMNTVKSTSLSE